MAWNPSPEVAVAREAAKKLGDLAKSPVNQIVAIYVTKDGRLGSVSYGETKVLCDDAKRLSDAMYKAAYKHFS